MGSSGSTTVNSRLVERERRDIAAYTAPKHVHWVEGMLHDIGADVAAIGRDFSRLPVKLCDVDYNDPESVYNEMVKGAEQERIAHETFAEREQRVYKAILGIIAMSETNIDDSWTPRYYRARCGAAKLESPLNVESTVAGMTPRDEIPGADRSLRDPSVSSTPLNTSIVGGRDLLALTLDNLHQHDADVPISPKTAPRSQRSVLTGRPRTASLLYNPPKTSPTLLAEEDEPLCDENGTELDDTNDLDGRRRQRAAVARFLSQFRQQWRLAEEAEREAVAAAGGKADDLQGADLSKRLSKVFYQARMCKKVLLTNAQHRVLLDARLRSEVEEAEGVKDPLAPHTLNPRLQRRAAASKRKEEAAKSRLGLVGDLQPNGAQKAYKEESDARVRALIDERIPPSPMVRSKNGGAEDETANTSMCSSLPFNELSPLRENTGLPGRRPPNFNAAGSDAPSDSFYLTDGEQVLDEYDVPTSPHVRTSSNDYLPGSMMREKSNATRVDDKEDAPSLDGTDNQPSPKDTTPSPIRPVGGDNIESNINSSDTPNKQDPQQPPGSPNYGISAHSKESFASASAAAAAEEHEELTAKDNATVGGRRETLIANCRSIDVLLYFCQGIMFYPSQRILYLLWHPWLGPLRDLGWDARIFTKDVKVSDLVSELKDTNCTSKTSKQFSTASSPAAGLTPKNKGPLIKTPAVPTPPDESGLIYIRHTQALRNFISDDMIGDVPEIEIAWSLEITLNKKPPGTSAVSLAFVDAHLVVHYCHIEEVSGVACCGGTSSLWRARAATFEQHVYDTFQVTTRYVPSLMGMAHAMHYEAELNAADVARGSAAPRGTIVRGTNSSPLKANKAGVRGGGQPAENTPLLGNNNPAADQQEEDRSLES